MVFLYISSPTRMAEIARAQALGQQGQKLSDEHNAYNDLNAQRRSSINIGANSSDLPIVQPFRFAYAHRDSLASEMIQQPESARRGLGPISSFGGGNQIHAHHDAAAENAHPNRAGTGRRYSGSEDDVESDLKKRYRLYERGRKLITIIRADLCFQVTQLPASMRLILIASAFDIFYSIFRLYSHIVSQRGHYMSYADQNCKAAMWGSTFFALLSVFARALLSVHLQLVIIHKIRHALTYEFRYMMGSLVLALILSLLPLCKNGYGWVEFDPTLGAGRCSYFSTTSHIIKHEGSKWWVVFDSHKDSASIGLAWMWGTYFGWVSLTVLYGGIVIFIVLYKLVQDRVQMKSAMQGQSAMMLRHNEGKEFMGLIVRVIRRILQFPALVVICHFLEVVWASITARHIIFIRDGQIDSDLSQEARWFYAMEVLTCFQGMLTLAFLPLEPPIHAFLGAWLKQVKGGSESGRDDLQQYLNDSGIGSDHNSNMPPLLGTGGHSGLAPSRLGEKNGAHIQQTTPLTQALTKDNSKSGGGNGSVLSRVFSLTSFREARLQSIYTPTQRYSYQPSSKRQSLQLSMPNRPSNRPTYASIKSPDDLPWEIVIHSPVTANGDDTTSKSALPNVPTLTIARPKEDQGYDNAMPSTSQPQPPLSAPAFQSENSLKPASFRQRRYSRPPTTPLARVSHITSSVDTADSGLQNSSANNNSEDINHLYHRQSDVSHESIPLSMPT
ncbi:hypothetical protein H4219_000362 [Mycoemilia scoparia]|uniref:Uncharacterized protein n=1 Tax=Mycoemilia scoparia TaxID=417184 RepID=A0A9W8DXJ2_9FUNG|nr:hypothetical protein H4219_000362 [Mycoemilia scoparia]